MAPRTRKSRLSAASRSLGELSGRPPLLLPAPPSISPPALPGADAKPPVKRRRRDPLAETAHQLRYSARSTYGCYLNSTHKTREDPQYGVKSRFEKARRAGIASWRARDQDRDDPTPLSRGSARMRRSGGTQSSTSTSTSSAHRRTAAGNEYDVRGAEQSPRGCKVLIADDSEEARIIFDVRNRSSAHDVLRKKSNQISSIINPTNHLSLTLSLPRQSIETGIGSTEVTILVNDWRAENGKTPSERVPVSVDALKGFVARSTCVKTTRRGTKKSGKRKAD